MRIAAVAEALPDHYYDQATITRCLERLWRGDPTAAKRLSALHANVQVSGRHLALPLEDYEAPRPFGQSNDAWIRVALDLGERAITEALRKAGLRAGDVDAIFMSTVTGVASPSLDARLVNRMGFRTDIKRTPMFGLGCVAGAAAVSRARDYIVGYPDHVAVVLTVELCSLTLQLQDRSVANLISTGLFGDGAGAAVIVGTREDATGGPEILATRSIFYPDTEDVMGWDISEDGFRIVLSSRVPVVAREMIPRDVDAFLAEHRLCRADIAAWICHPGGPRVLQALQDGLGLERDDLAVSWQSLDRCGNLSSASVLLVLRAFMEERRPPPESRAILMAMGPGFCSELLLLRF